MNFLSPFDSSESVLGTTNGTKKLTFRIILVILHKEDFMEQKTEQKQDPRKLPEKSGGKAVIFGGMGLTAAALAGYLGICTMAQTSNTILGNVSINDISVGGLSKTEAIATVTATLDSQLQSTSILYTQDDWNGLLQGNFALAEVEDAVDAAYELGRSSFLSSGISFLSGVSGSQGELMIPLTLNDTGRSQFDTLLDEADATIQGAVVQCSWTVDVENETLWMTKGVSGESINREDAETATLTALSSGNSSHKVSLVKSITRPNDPNFNDVRNAVYTDPVSATIDSELNVIDHVVGVDFDPKVASGLYSQAEEGETFAVPLITTQPEETADMIRSYLFADVLAESSSVVTGTTSRRNNVILATKFCDGVVLMPGETFSFYEHCAPYSLANGYQEATAYVAGQTVSEVAGGICQVSSTLYVAVLKTELKVEERRSHQFTVDYLPQAMDATVYSNVTDFKFTNNTPYPIKILAETYTSNGSLYTDFTLMGTKTSDVTIVPKSTVYNYVTQETQYVADESVPVGKKVYAQTAYTGSTATLTRYHYDVNGNLIKEETMHTDRYNSRPAIIHYNPADAYSMGLSDTPPVVAEAETPPSETGMDIVNPDDNVDTSTTPEVTPPELAPEPEVTPESTPVPESTPEPESTPVPEATPEPESIPVPEPTPEPESIPVPEPTPEPETTPVSEPSSQPVVEELAM